MKDPKKLTELALQVTSNSTLKPLLDGTTFCNVATQQFADGLGYEGFKGLMANQMVDLMVCSDQWEYTADMEKAQAMVNDGTWIVAGERGEHHGHVVTLIPGTTVVAGHWGFRVPVCVNVGKDVFMGKGLNWAFHNVPKLYAWRPSI